MPVLISVTCKNRTEASRIARSLLKKKLVACANWWPVDSLYWWQGKINSDQEMMLVLKSLDKNVSKIKKEITVLHSYQIPVIGVEKIGINYLAGQWLKSVIR